MSERHEIWQVADALQMDLRAASAKLVELRARLASLDLPDQALARCGVCGVPLRGPKTLAEHIYHSHGGEVPAHWLAVEAMSEEAA